VARFNDGVEDIKDLKEGMLLEGTVSNVAQFGAFVDLGVHQDGLVHVSQLAHKFVSDAREVVKTGDIVKVKVLEVDVARKRISLTMKLDDEATTQGGAGARDNRFEGAGRGQQQPSAHSNAQAACIGRPSALAAAFAKLQQPKNRVTAGSPYIIVLHLHQRGAVQSMDAECPAGPLPPRCPVCRAPLRC
jgi:uncharacterized protein